MHHSVNYTLYKEPLFDNGLVKHALLKEKIAHVESRNKFEVKIAGYSAQKREIYQLTIGQGPVSVMLWSQMHGDEPTGTRAFFDLFNFLQADDEHNALRQLILSRCTLHFIPMLNPDGAEINERRNAQGIDINRDFLQQQSPEARLLIQLHQQIRPAFGFNMHDQGALWSVQGTQKPAAISLLAPPADDFATINPNRLKAIKLIAGIYEMLLVSIPGQIGKWSEDFESRAFGDNLQRLGTATLLIEAGGYPNDENRQYVRDLNFKILLYALEQIATAEYHQQNSAIYHQIPQNTKNLFHFIIKNVLLRTPGGNVNVDIGLNHDRAFDVMPLPQQALYTVQDVGDLSIYNAYKIINAQGSKIEQAINLCGVANFTVVDETQKRYCFTNGRLAY